MHIKTERRKDNATIDKWLIGLIVGLLLMLGFGRISEAVAIINDPLGDHAASPDNPVVDIGAVEVSGDANNIRIRVSFSPDTDMSQVVGVIDLDTDQDPSTGQLPMVSKQNIGVDFFLDLFPLATGDPVNVYDSGSNIVGTVSASIAGQSLEITVPLSLLGNDDGNMDVGISLGNQQAPTDDAPNVGPFVLRLNAQSFHAGDTLALTSTVVPTVSPMAVDVYVALMLPDGTLILLREGGQLTLEIGPFLAGFSVPPLDREVFQYTFVGAEPPGSYSWLGVFTEPGTLDFIGAVSQVPFTFGR